MVETHAELGADLIVQASEDLTAIAELVRMHATSSTRSGRVGTDER